MNYPTMEEVEHADRIQLCRWHRFLKSPGSSAISQPDFRRVLDEEAQIMTRIQTRLQDAGGFTSEISKHLGWGRR